MSHTICWFDLPAEDLERAVLFYSKVLDKNVTIEEQHGFKMGVFPHDNSSVDCNNSAKYDVAGCIFEAKPFQANTSELTIYFNVEGRIKDAVSLVEQFGGKIISDIESIGPWGYRALIKDSEGNRVALYSFTNNDQ